MFPGTSHIFSTFSSKDLESMSPFHYLHACVCVCVCVWARVRITVVINSIALSRALSPLVKYNEAIAVMSVNLI